MTIKEKPFINAMSNWGMLPGFLFENAFVAGAVTIFVCALCGIVTMLFQVYGRGEGDAVVLLEAARLGALIFVLIGAFALLLVAGASMRSKDSSKSNIHFAIGGAIGVVLLIIIDVLASDALRTAAASLGTI